MNRFEEAICLRSFPLICFGVACTWSCRFVSIPAFSLFYNPLAPSSRPKMFPTVTTSSPSATRSRTLCSSTIPLLSSSHGIPTTDLQMEEESRPYLHQTYRFSPRGQTTRLIFSLPLAVLPQRIPWKLEETAKLPLCHVQAPADFRFRFLNSQPPLMSSPTNCRPRKTRAKRSRGSTWCQIRGGPAPFHWRQAMKKTPAVRRVIRIECVAFAIGLSHMHGVMIVCLVGSFCRLSFRSIDGGLSWFQAWNIAPAYL